MHHVAKDLAIGSIAQGLVACVPSSAFSSEVDRLLSSLNDRSATIMVVVPQDGLDVRVGLVSLGQTIFSFGQHLLQMDVLGQELIEIVDQRVAIYLCRLLCSLQGVHLFEGNNLPENMQSCHQMQWPCRQASACRRSSNHHEEADDNGDDRGIELVLEAHIVQGVGDVGLIHLHVDLVNLIVQGCSRSCAESCKHCRGGCAGWFL